VPLKGEFLTEEEVSLVVDVVGDFFIVGNFSVTFLCVVLTGTL